MTDDRLSIIEDGQALKSGSSVPPWLLLIVDDDDSVHQATRFALGDFSFEDRELQILSAYSAEQARQVIAEQIDTAVILLDVVMESEYVGLDLVRWIREELENERVRIVLRTGQPGFAPEFQVVRDYDINDYKEKNELTAAKLVTTVYAALRSFRDIKRLESQTDRLAGALRTAETASRAKSSFITHMSHEFRTPLNGILGLSEMIATEILGPVGNPRYKEYAWDIINSGRRLLAMVESVLEMSESAQSDLDFQPFDLRGLINEFFEQEAREAKGGDSSFQTEPAEPDASALLLHADRNAVRTMLMNLVTNALKHNPANCNVRVTARQTAGGGLVLSVIDDGRGIEQEVIDNLGDLFNLENDPYVTGQEGLGLGLVATKRLIERHGGSISIESERGKGTTVRLFFPTGSLVSSPPPDDKPLN